MRMLLATLWIGCGSTSVPQPVVVEPIRPPAAAATDAVSVDDLVSPRAVAAFRLDFAQLRGALGQVVLHRVIAARLGEVNDDVAHVLPSIDRIQFELVEESNRIRTGAAVLETRWTSGAVARAVRGALREPRVSANGVHRGRRRTVIALDSQTHLFGDTTDIEMLGFTLGPTIRWSHDPAVVGWCRRTHMTETLFRSLVGEGPSERAQLEVHLSETDARLVIELDSEQPQALRVHAIAALEERKRQERFTAALIGGATTPAVLDSVHIEAVDGALRWTATMPPTTLDHVWVRVTHTLLMASFAPD